MDTLLTGDRSSRATAWSAMSDEELLLAYRDRGERQAFETLVHRYEKDLYRYLRRHLGDSAKAEDAFQQTFLQLHLKCQSYEPGRPVRPWLYTMATHQAIDSQRRERRHKMMSSLDRTVTSGTDDVGALVELLVSGETSPGAAVEAGERREWLRGALSELPEPLRQAIHLVYYQGLSYRDAAEVLNVPVGTVKSRVHTSILKLNRAWKRAHSPHENLPDA